MQPFPILLLFFLLLLVFSSLSLAAPTPTSVLLVLCGSSTNASVGIRTFVGDAYLSAAMTSSSDTVAANASSSLSDSSIANPALYQTARIFTGVSSYAFAVPRAGRYFIRLYFLPFVFPGYNLSAANFAVSAQDVILLPAFSTAGGGGSSSSNASTAAASFKEFSVNVTGTILVVSFTPGSAAPGLAFVNAIEIVPVPDTLIADAAAKVDPPGPFAGLASQALETAYRINMGDATPVTPSMDVLWRTWVPDQPFLADASLVTAVTFTGPLDDLPGFATTVTAPYVVYSTAEQLAQTSTTLNALFNMTWGFAVDAGASYLLRFHFCDIVNMTAGELVFNVYVGGTAVLSNFDLAAVTNNTLAAPLYKDFVLSTAAANGNLTVSVGPSKLPNVLPNGILNGLEIMKILGNSTGGAAAAPLPAADVAGTSNSEQNQLPLVLGGVAGGVALLVLSVTVTVCICMRRRKKGRVGGAGGPDKQLSRTRTPPTKALRSAFSMNGLSRVASSTGAGGTATITLGHTTAATLGLRIPLAAVQEATHNFDEAWVIGVGGFGKVYRGELRDGTRVAVKRGTANSQQGLHEFRTEVDMLSRLRHRHLVALIGYCDERGEMIIIYEYMANGTLKSHLYGSDLPALPWRQRLQICIGAARGLHYLHTGSTKAIIHRDVKSANILLDDNLMAKVADFGLSKAGPELDKTHVSTAVKGSFGYLDPEYFRRQQLTDKSDVYSFGVVLMEVLAARPVVDPRLPREMVNLAEWGAKRMRNGELEQLLDDRIAGTITQESLRKFGETILKCLADCGADRPSMGDVLWSLEYALQLQEAAGEAGAGADSTNLVAGAAGAGTASSASLQRRASMESAGGDVLNSMDLNEIGEDVSMRKMFSQMIKGDGR